MRAKNHDQRKGQWLINHIRMGIDYKEIADRTTSLNDLTRIENNIIHQRLWHMENGEFEAQMRLYDE